MLNNHAHSVIVSHHWQLALWLWPWMTTDENTRTHATDALLIAAAWAQDIVWFFFVVRPLRPLAYRRRRRRGTLAVGDR